MSVAAVSARPPPSLGRRGPPIADGHISPSMPSCEPSSFLHSPTSSTVTARRPSSHSFTWSASSTLRGESRDPLSKPWITATSPTSPPASTTTASTTPAWRRRRQKSKMTVTMPMAPDCQYEELPPAIRRKYFSTLERLRLAQNAQHPPTESRFHVRKLSRTASSDFISRPATAGGARRLQKPRSNQAEFLQVQSDASWFLSLPEKVRRKQFTREEQILYSGRCEEVILDAADEAVYRSRANRSLQTLDSYLSDDSSINSDTDMGAAAEESRVDLGEEAEDSFRWMGADDDLDSRLALDDYHMHIAGSNPNEVVREAARARKASFRRTLSLTSNPFARSSAPSSPPIPATPIEKPYSHSRKPSNGFSIKTSKHISKPSVSTVDPEAAYYQDPEARLKLRVYLASPQKFDEAIEFGFPSTDGANKENAMPHRPKSGTKRSDATDDTQTFLKDDNASLFEDDESIEETDAPITPREMESFRAAHRLPPNSSKGNSTDSSAPSMLNPRKHGDTYAHALAGSREMTLRMTLTRPDLRADENVIYGWQGKPKEDPLALEELPPMAEEERTMMMGPFGGPDGWGPPPKDDNVMKKFWKRVKTTGSSTRRVS